MAASPGNKNAAKGTAFRDALRKTLRNYEKGDIERGKALESICNKLVKEALDPESSNYQFAVKEIGLRIDGTPKSNSDSGSTSQILIGVSPAFAGLIAATGGTKSSDGETIVSDGSLLSTEICIGPGGHGEGVDISEVQGSTE